jgi:serine-type D-Ala-D-Ala carboxypeptidase/endopeptidase (penicillin-binding protein 4)
MLLIIIDVGHSTFKGIFYSPNVIAAETLDKEITQFLNHDPDLKGALAGISIRSATTGKIIFDHMGDIRLKPASNLKLFSAAAALSTLGEDYTFQTEVLTDGSVKGKRLSGNLFLKGKGDPTLLKADFDKMADQIYQKGVRVIHGDLIGDDTWYDNIRYSRDLPWSDEHTYYGAQVSALTVSPDQDYDSGTLIVKVQPSKIKGQKAEVTISPSTNYVKIVNQTKTVKENEPTKLTILREHGKNTILIKGTIPIHSHEIKDWVSVWNPTSYALNLFKQSLEEKGIKIKGNVKEGTAPLNAVIITVHQSMPLSKMLVPFMKLSNNTHAEVFVKEMGKVYKNEGSWEKGLEVVKNELFQLGINTETLVLRDGSGISHINLVPANELSQLLFMVQSKEWFPTLLQSLPEGGKSEKMVGGTLRYRLQEPSTGAKIHAKTGTLTTVSSLSGYVNTQKGDNLIFSVILNNLIDESKGKRIEDKIVSILVNQ